MKNLLPILILPLLLSACATGDQLYLVGERKNKDGGTTKYPVLVASLNTDTEGDYEYTGFGHRISVKTPPGYSGQFERKVTYNKSGQIISEENRPIIARRSNSNVIKAWFEGLGLTFDKAGNLVFKGTVTGAAAAFAGPAAGAIP